MLQPLFAPAAVNVTSLPEGGMLLRSPQRLEPYPRCLDLPRKAFDEEGFYRIGDAGRLADPDDAALGIEFNRRITEDFKLTSGTWVNVGAVRVQAIAAGVPVIQDVVITGHDRAEIGLLVFPSEQGCRALCPDAPSTMPLSELIYEPTVRRRIKDALAAMAADSTGSPTCPARVLLMSEPPLLDAGEITDKGYVNQRAVLARRSMLVERLHAAMPEPEIIVAPRAAGRIAA